MDRAPLDRLDRVVVSGALVATGAAALIAQIAWQRVIAINAGVDLESSVTVVAAFLAGLGLGNLAGGRIADRCNARRALGVLAGASVVLCGLSAISVPVLYHLYASIAPHLDGLVVRVAVNALVLLPPAFLEGWSLPLAARAVAHDQRLVGSQVGRLHAANTIGAALGASVGGWLLLGRFGLTGVAMVAGGLQLGAGVLYLGLALDRPTVRSLPAKVGSWLAVVLLALGVGWGASQALDGPGFNTAGPVLVVVAVALAATWGALAYLRRPRASAGDTDDGVAVDAATVADPVASSPGSSGTPWRWYLAYGATGAIALGYEQVFFRMVDRVLLSNSYTFAYVLSWYLVLLGIGSAIGSWLQPRVRDPRRAFLWLAYGVGATATLGLVLVGRVLPDHVLGRSYDGWFGGDGFVGGFFGVPLGDVLLFGVALPLVLMGLPVLCMGAAFPFVQSLVATDLDELGRRTGGIIFANLIGNVVGTLAAGFVLIERWGTVGTYRILLVPLIVAGILAARFAPSTRVRVGQAAAVTVLAVALLAATPSGPRLWSQLGDRSAVRYDAIEDRSCVSGLARHPDGGSQLYLNGISQNGYPFDDFHVLIGLVPVLVHDDPKRALAVGFGIGSTSYSMLSSPRTGSVTSVELCGGNYDLAAMLADEGAHEFQVIDGDPRHHEVVGDGRRYLLGADDGFDVVVPDTLRPSTGGSGNLYSRDFQELVSDRLDDDGIVAGWIPTPRSLNAVTATYPYVVRLSVPNYSDSPFYLASRSPIDIDPAELVERFDALPAEAYEPEQRAALRAFLETIEPECVNDGERAVITDPYLENRDLHPRDEYFLTAGALTDDDIARTCGVGAEN